MNVARCGAGSSVPGGAVAAAASRYDCDESHERWLEHCGASEGRPAAGAGDAWAGLTFGDLRPEQGDVRHGGKRTARSSRIRAIGV